MKKEQEQERERLGLNGGPPAHDSLPSAGVHGGGPSMSDLMRRRRTDAPFGLHAVHTGSNVNVGGLPSGAGQVAASMTDALGMQSVDPQSYDLSMASGIQSMSGGYGHHHYVQQQEAFQGARAGIPPVSPVTPISPADTFNGGAGYSANANALSQGGMMHPGAPGSVGAYYDSLTQQQTAEFDERKPSPTPRNQLPPDATLCSPFSTHPLPGSGH